MKITKDEAVVLEYAIFKAKWNLYNSFSSKEEANALAHAIDDLELRLKKASDDRRRHGRRSRNDFSDILRRISKKYNEEKSKVRH